MSLWSDELFQQLAKIVSTLITDNYHVLRCIISATSNIDLTRKLSAITSSVVQDVPNNVILELNHCLLRTMATQTTDGDIAEKIYLNWFDEVKNGGAEYGLV